MVGIADSEALLPRVRAAFEGYRLLREYFLMPERFHYLRLAGLNPALRECTAGLLEIVVLLSRARPAIADIAPRDLRLFATPVVNLFEKECDAVEIDPRTSAHVLHADRTRPRDFEIYRPIRVEDAETAGVESILSPVHGTERDRGSGFVYATERRPRRAGEDELRRGQMRTSYPGDDVFISVARLPGTPQARRIRRLDIRALCTNRDLPILDDTPRLTPEGGEPIAQVELLGPMRRPQPALTAGLPTRQAGGEAAFDALAWRLVAQLSLDHLSLANGPEGAEPLRTLLDLYAERGDPALSRHARAIQAVRARRVIERLGLPGPMCFGQGIEITLAVDDAVLAGASALLLPALLDRLFARHAGINGFVRTRTELLQRREEVAWPMTPGRRALI
jgi:type VI secretion system protein ImpG